MKKSFFLALLILLASLSRAQDRTFLSEALSASPSDTHWQPINPPGNTGFNMTIIGVVQFDGVEQFSDQLEVGAFHNGECRGAALTNVVAMNRNFVFLTVYGLDGEEDTFRIYDHATETELDMATTQTITYVDNGSLGTLPNPYIINFIPNHFVITATAEPYQGGTVTGAGVYYPGDIATLTATANAGYTFINWTKNGTVVSTNPIYSFTVTEDASYVAYFEAGDDLPGDANRDRTVNAYDIVIIVNYIFDENPEVFFFDNADVNGDGVVDALDIVVIINLIFSK